MNFNNRLSSTLANNINLDSNVEHEAEKIAGGNIIWLVNRPAGVKIYVNSTPDRTGALVLNEANRGYKWEQLGEYGSLKLYDNFYIWTEGTNLNNDKIELQVSPNADIITPILGNTADKIAAVESVDFIKNIRSVDKSIDTIDSFSDKALIQLNNAIFNTYNKVDPVIECLICGEIEISEKMLLAHLPFESIASLNLKDDEFYRIQHVGHFDLGRKEESSLADACTATAHLCAFKNTSNAAFESITNQQFNNLFKVSQNPWSNESTDLFDLWGIKYVSSYTGDKQYGIVFEHEGLNFKPNDFIIKGSLLNKYENFGLFWNLSTIRNVFQSHSSIHLTISRAYSNIINE